MGTSGLVIALMGALVGAGLGVWAVRRTTSRKLRTTTEAVTRMETGDADARAVETGQTELAELAAAVNRLAEHLGNEVRRSKEEQHVRDLILSSMQEGVLLVGGEGQTVFANDALERHLLGRPAGLTTLVPLSLRSAVESAAVTEEAVSVEVETGTPSRWLRGTAVPAAGGNSVLLVVRDVTEAKRLEAIRRDFVANASHELKTPAASIQATAETIRRAAVDDPGVVPRFAEQLDREAIRLSRIVADLLDLSRLESGSELGDLVRLDAIVREEAERFHESAAQAQVSLEFDAAPVPTVRGSARDLALLVRNLVDNAIRYTKPGGRVDVSVVDGADGQVALKVSDTGIGIPSRDLPRVFERFYRVDRARSRETGGTGLGLAIVKHVTENHGGRVSVTSELGRGTRFEIRLPQTGDESRGTTSGV